ncbi:BRO family, N-terminal domain protein [Hallella bergensis DSM 17361]|uniref:BRO family, N-terminal domain protein n=1 Tax=Hallella bergensis DSM 17361 TaxID=585502 RepID=D1Q069_9BACT|nr:BRO family protein [Hallella bergensis]EFA42968.1 BRO family, N-terminal domain protein [Hallella bergensis DSM 17361]
METRITIFNNPQFGDIRTAGTPEAPLFCLADVCKSLELQASAVIRQLDDGVITRHPISDSLGRQQVANFVSEDGLYDVILDSRKPEAKVFHKWITSEVIAPIKKTGGYSLSNRYPMSLIERAA